jgi:hypothetical protein
MTTEVKLIASGDPLELREFGATVSLSGNYALVGAPNHHSPYYDNSSGAAYVFVKSGTNWVEQAKLSPS